MVDVTKAYPNPVNIPALREAVQAQYPQATWGDNGFRVHGIAEENVATVSAELDSIIAAHDPQVLSTNQQQAVVQEGAKAQAAAIPNWASWSESEVLAWFDTNITAGLPAANLAAANVVLSNMATALRAMARLNVAMRNQLWSDLQSE